MEMEGIVARRFGLNCIGGGFGRGGGEIEIGRRRAE
jgi:hypothetical protein